MKILTSIILFVFICICISCDPPKDRKLALNIVTHNESGRGYENIYKDSFDEVCYALQSFGRTCTEHGACWQLGCSESLLKAVEDYTATSKVKFPSGISNILQDLQKTYGVSIDVHTHDEKSIGEMACRLIDLGVVPSVVISGFQCYQPNWLEWTELTAPYSCSDPKNTWMPKVLWGAGTPKHKYDPTEIGIWKPKSETEFNSHDSSNLLWYYGDGNHFKIADDAFKVGDIPEELRNRVANMEKYDVPDGRYYPTSIFLQESLLFDAEFRSDMSNMMEEINSKIENVVWTRVDVTTLLHENWYGATGFIMKADMSDYTELP